MTYKKRAKVVYALLYTALSLLALICLLPFLIMIVNATRTGNEIMTSFTLIPSTNLANNWAVVSANLNVMRGFFNSLFVAVCVTFLSSYFSSLTAYALSFYRFAGGKIVFAVMLVFMMVPAQLGLLGFYNLVNTFGMIDTYYPLILPAIASPATVFFLRQYCRSTIPASVLEAPRIDGASELRIFHTIAIPMMAPGIATMAIGCFIGSWNNYLIPLILLNTPDKFTLPVMVASLNSVKDIASNQGAIYLTLTISVVPILIVFAFCSRYIISGISAGAVKE